MRFVTSVGRWAPGVCFAVSLLSAPRPGTPGDAAAQTSDAALEQRVEQALEAASDLPAGAITVRVQNGVVSLSGSVACEDCGGNRTPGGFGTVQQSLGAVVRAVPGVRRVEFRLDYDAD